MSTICSRVPRSTSPTGRSVDCITTASDIVKQCSKRHIETAGDLSFCGPFLTVGALYWEIFIGLVRQNQFGLPPLHILVMLSEGESGLILMLHVQFLAMQCHLSRGDTITLYGIHRARCVCHDRDDTRGCCRCQRTLRLHLNPEALRSRGSLDV